MAMMRSSDCLAPVSDAARALAGRFLERRFDRLLHPFGPAGSGVESLHQTDAVRSVEHAIDHDGSAAEIIRRR